MKTLQEKYVAALIDRLGAVDVPSRSNKYITLQRPDGAYYFVGRAGAVRAGRSVSESVPLPDEIKRRLLRHAEAMIRKENGE